MPDQKPSPWWSPDRLADRRPFLLARNRITTALRADFAARDFVEVETPALQVSPGNEAHLHAFATEVIDISGGRDPLYLRTSPEFAAKKLLRPANRDCSSWPGCGATARAARCMRPSSPCSNGIRRTCR